jgi:hypothetical protein
MLPMATGVTETDFVDGKWSRNAMPNDPETQRRMKKARSLLWKELGGYKVWACKCYKWNTSTVRSDYALGCDLI